MDNPIDRALGLRPLEDAIADEQQISAAEVVGVPEFVEDTPINIVTVNVEDDETIRDIEQARLNIKNIIEQGDDSLQEMIQLAKQSESPRAFEVAANLMKTLLDANKDFVDMSMKKKYAKEEILNPKEESNTTNVTNNNLILSTAGLLAMIKGETDE